MMQLNAGAIAALATAFAWTFTALAFEYAAKRIGSLALNFLRLLVGFVFLGIYCLVVRGSVLPLDAPLESWLWLGASGLVGFVIGDLLLFQAFIDIGSRIAMLVYATAPAMTALLGFIALGERITLVGAGGMALTIAGIAIVVTGKRAASESRARTEAEAGGPARPADRPRRLRGLVLAAGGALGQAGGLVLGKLGAGPGSGGDGAAAMNPFAGTQIRVSAGILGFAAILVATRSWKGIWTALKDRRAVASLTAGAFFGPFLGVSLSLLAVQLVNAGVASAIMSIVPVLIIAPSALIMKERVTASEILGSLVAVAGVFVLFLA
jgi:drug/metabolite transporter (DMT)-like permease